MKRRAKKSSKKPRRHDKRWTAEDDLILSWGWGLQQLDTLMRKLERSPGAIMRRAIKLEIGPALRGRISMQKLIRITGYNEPAIKTAAKRAGVTLRRLPLYRRKKSKAKIRRYAIDPEQVEQIIAELKRQPNPNRIELELEGIESGAWGGHKKPPACRACHSTKHPHRGRGLCRPCYRYLHGRGMLGDFPRSNKRYGRLL